MLGSDFLNEYQNEGDSS